MWLEKKDPGNNWMIRKAKLTTVDGKRYDSNICAYPLRKVNWFNPLTWLNYITASNRTEITILTELLDEMADKLANTTLTAYASIYSRIVGRDRDNPRKRGKYYCIGNTSSVDLKSSAPKLDLRYRVGGVTHAIVVVWVKPFRAEKGLRNELIERRGSDDFGFSSRCFMEIVKESMIHSASNKCRVCIFWTLEDRDAVEEFLAKIMRTVKWTVTHPNVINVSICAVKVIVKTVASGILKSAMDGISSGAGEIAAKVLSQETREYVSENVLKRIPGLGIIAVLILILRRLWSGDQVGAMCEVVSGYYTGWGVILTVAMDVVLCLSDLQEGGAIGKQYRHCVMMLICGILTMMTMTLMTMT